MVKHDFLQRKLVLISLFCYVIIKNESFLSYHILEISSIEIEGKKYE